MCASRFTCAAFVATIAIGASCLLADPGPGLPFFRRPILPSARHTRPAPVRQAEELKIPKPFAPPTDALVIGGQTIEQTEGDEVDVAEVLRRGDHVTRAGRGPMGTEDRTIGDAVAPPPDDSHKWFISIIVDRGARESESLLYDLKHSPDLRAWASPDEPKDSWSHVTVYVKGDESQDWRWKGLRIERYPVMLLQPPANLLDDKDPKSWEWGDPKTVVWQWDGYDATSPERAKLRSDAIRKALLAYCTKINAARERREGTGPRADRPTPGARQSVKPSDNTAAPVFPQTINIPVVNPVNQVSPDPLTPANSILQESVAGLAGTLLSKVVGSPTTWLVLLAALKIFELVAARTPNKTDDRVAALASFAVGHLKTPGPSPMSPGGQS